MKVTVLRPTSDVVLIVLVGELDTVTAPHWSTVLHRELDSRPKVVVFDLGAVSFFGVAALIGTARRCTPACSPAV